MIERKQNDKGTDKSDKNLLLLCVILHFIYVIIICMILVGIYRCGTVR